MIATMLRIFWIHLRRDRVVWLLTFIVPVAFFSIFAVIFSGMGCGSAPTVRVAVVDEDGSDFSKKLVVALEKDKALRVTMLESKDGDVNQQGTALTRQEAEMLVRNGKVSAAIILPKKLGASFPSFTGDQPTVEVLADTSDPVAPQMLSGMLQGLVMTAAPDAMMKKRHRRVEQMGRPADAAAKGGHRAGRAIPEATGRGRWEGRCHLSFRNAEGQGRRCAGP